MLRGRCSQRGNEDGYDDLWQGQCMLFAMLRKGEPRLGLPALGGLFGQEQTAEFEGAFLSNKALLSAVEQLTLFRLKRDRVLNRDRVRVNYRDMDTEELGSIYESLLELVPRIDFQQRRFFFAGFGDEAALAGHERKLTGSYYTPKALVNRLVDQVMNPLLDETGQHYKSDPCAAILRLKVVDPACGSGHFLLAAARKLAARLAQLRGSAEQAKETAEKFHFFHWFLEFDKVFEKGGFDCVLGNPPWERLQFEEREYFAGRDPAVELEAFRNWEPPQAPS